MCQLLLCRYDVDEIFHAVPVRLERGRVGGVGRIEEGNCSLLFAQRGAEGNVGRPYLACGLVAFLTQFVLRLPFLRSRGSNLILARTCVEDPPLNS